MLLGRGLFNEVETPRNRFMNSCKKSCSLGGVVARSAGTIGTSRTSRPTGAARTSGSVRASGSSGFVWTACLRVVIFITLVVSVCSVSQGIGFASESSDSTAAGCPPLGVG